MSKQASDRKPSSPLSGVTVGGRFRPPKQMARVTSIAAELCNRLWRKKRDIPVVFYDKRANVGDQLNYYIIEKITGRKIYRVHTRAFAHLVGIGSILGNCRRTTHVWGAGIMKSGSSPGRVVAANIHAVRGSKTLELIKQSRGLRSFNCPLGDPAVLLPLIYQPSESIRKSNDVGVVCHYVDEHRFREFLSVENGCVPKIIPVELPPEQFVNEVVSCNRILSSSLHGLIISDAYAVPNKWVKFSDDILGGDFKYLDYYSTTVAPAQKPVSINSPTKLGRIVRDAERLCSVKRYKYDPGDLLAAFPFEVFVGKR